MTGITTRLLAGAVIALCATVSVRAETPEQWITLGARVHGAFGSFLPVGIRIGLDALKRLDAKPRGVTVVYYSIFGNRKQMMASFAMHQFSVAK